MIVEISKIETPTIAMERIAEVRLINMPLNIMITPHIGESTIAFIIFSMDVL
jgi:hypothetical protein